MRLWTVIGLLSASLASHSQNLSPPSVQLVDEFGVNLANGQVNQTLETIAIGGSMGLSHNISLYTNHFFPSRGYGYMDKFNARALYSQIPAPSSQVQAVMRVHDHTGSADFMIFVDGVRYNGSGTSTQNYTYVALRDERERLTVTGADRRYLDWTKADGTVSRFERVPNAFMHQEGRLRQVIYPNGFTINIDFPTSVSTNTGFSLVYQYEGDASPPPSCPNPPGNMPQNSPASWAVANPRRVKAVNSAICAHNDSACLARSWPTATFTWPAGMPRIMYCQESTFSVQTPAGTTSFTYKPRDLAYSGTSTTTLAQGQTLGERVSPRLYKIKPASSDVATIEYSYKNLYQVYVVGVREDFIYAQENPGTFPTEMGFYEFLVQEAGGMYSARVLDRTMHYDIGSTYMGQGYAQNVGGQTGGVWRVINNVARVPSIINLVDGKHARVFYESSDRNFPYRLEHYNGLVEEFTYTRGNVSEVKANGVTMTRAEYPPAGACDTNPKTCNLPKYVWDAENNRTEYEYHAESGQVSRIIPPADDFGRVAEKRFDYQQFRARYYDSSGNRVEGSPIYLKVAERHCHDGNYASASPAAGCVGTYEVITRFEYNHNNLLLTSAATTDTNPANPRTLRTCYQYDVYGNKIGETQPKGAATCR